MTDRNHELLILCGYGRQERWKSVYWVDLDGNATSFGLLPKPYDNLQDAMDLVPKGYAVMQFTCSLYSSASIYPTDDGKEGIRARSVVKWPEDSSAGASPAEALAQAIYKVKMANEILVKAKCEESEKNDK